MKVLFVLSFLRAASWQMYYSEGIASLSAVLKKNGYETDLFLVEDLKDVKSLNKYIKKTKPKIIAFSITSVQYPGIRWILKEIKKRFKSIFIVVGGVHCSLNPNLIIKNPAIDAVCIGEGEYALLELVDKLKKGKSIEKIDNLWVRINGKVVKNKMIESNDINKLPEPDRDIFQQKNLDSYTGSVWLKKGLNGGMFLMSRGCVFECSYCASPALNAKYGSKYYRLLDFRKGVRQIKKAVKKYKYDYIIFVDDTFTINKGWVKDFLKLYKKEVGLPFNIQTRINTFDLELMKLIKQTGGYMVIVGVESGDKKIRELILNRSMTNEQIRQGVKWIKQAGMKVGTYNMMGLPRETPNKFKKTLILNARIESDFPYIFIFYPYENTKIYRICKDSDLILKKLSSDFVAREDTPLNLDNFKREDILYYYKNFNNLFNRLKKIKAREKTVKKLKKDWWFKIGFMPPSSKWFWLTSRLWKLYNSNIV